MQKGLRLLIVLSILALATSAIAAENSGRFVLAEAAQLNGKNLAAGEYKIHWDGQGQAVQVTVSQGRKTITTAPAKLVERGEKAPRNAVVLNSNSGGGPSSIVELQLSGKRSALVFDTTTAANEKQAQ